MTFGRRWIQSCPKCAATVEWLSPMAGCSCALCALLLQPPAGVQAPGRICLAARR